MTGKKLFLFSLIIFSLVLWTWGLRNFVRDARQMRPQQPISPAAAIVVLTGGSRRVETGFMLLQQGKGQKLFISGVQRGVEAKALMRVARQESAKQLDCCIVLGDAENTAGNAVETAVWLHKEQYRSLYLVTANYHMRRALLELQRVAPDLDVRPYPVEPEGIDMKIWWRDAVTRTLLIREYTKYILAFLRHLLMDPL